MHRALSVIVYKMSVLVSRSRYNSKNGISDKNPCVFFVFWRVANFQVTRLDLQVQDTRFVTAIGFATNITIGHFLPHIIFQNVTSLLRISFLSNTNILNLRNAIFTPSV